jgi:hypothetical protein
MIHFVALERSSLISPVWLVPFDDYARAVRTAGLQVQLERWDGEAWLPMDTLPVRTPSGALAYPRLGERAPQPRRHRVRLAAAGYQPLYPADDEPFDAGADGIEFTVQPYSDTQPPPATRPRLVRLLPGVSFPYPPGVRTVHGIVRDAATKAPVVNALVEAHGQTDPDLTPWRERTLSGPAGAFRLALRWQGRQDDAQETFRLQATERPGRTGSLVVRLPQDAGARHVIEISEQ